MDDMVLQAASATHSLYLLILISDNNWSLFAQILYILFLLQREIITKRIYRETKMFL